MSGVILQLKEGRLLVNGTPAPPGVTITFALHTMENSRLIAEKDWMMICSTGQQPTGPASMELFILDGTMEMELPGEEDLSWLLK